MRLGALVLLLAVAGPARAGELPRYDLAVHLDPETHHLRVSTFIDLPEGSAGEFLLNADLTIVQSDHEIERIPLGDVAPFFGINAGPAGERPFELARYRFELPPSSRELVLAYEGTIDYGLSDAREEYTRGFRDTAGMIGAEGVFLAGQSFWYPRFDDGLVEFTMEVEIPDGWHVISQGDGNSRDEEGVARWDSVGPMDEIYLCGGPLVRYRESAGAVEALVFLREPDDTLAGNYLEATAQYLEMYRELIGPYPYGKFALVENFWETGFGMPSFTLLGPTVIRFPFILHSSYPHEILHNWWGNSVFVDYASGNWCEGLTAYLADHLIQEQRGRGAEYRRGTLQKYRNYVKEGRDFPLAEFRSRHSAATEAVGYGKALMGFHMLRMRLGDEAFRKALARFYRQQRGRRASFADLRAVFEAEAGESLETFFRDWVDRAGAASLRVRATAVRGAARGFLVGGSLSQVQEGDPIALDVPVVVRTARGVERKVVRMEERERPFSIRTIDEPLLLEVDPDFDLFRLLDPHETPPSIGQVFGEPRILAVLPAAAPAARLDALRALLEGWRSESHEVEIVLDRELERLPADRAAWIVGRDNVHAATLFADGAVAGLEPGTERVRLGDESAPLANHTFVVMRRHPENAELAVGWLVVDPDAALPGLGRKLPHYGKYSYLAFQGDEPANVIKGQWPAAGSPLRVDLRPEERRGEPLPRFETDERNALAELPPVFSEKALAAHVDRLAAPGMEGRGLGSDGLRRAAEYIAGRFEAAGLKPGGDDGGWLQRFPVERGPGGEPVEAFNVVGYLPGGREEWKGQSVVLGAHYDHLGRGWPDVHAGDEGAIHPGADDNASGVAVMLELARNLAGGEPPSRSLVFVAFSGEEAGRLGSRWYVDHATLFPLDGVRSMINLDTVGRLERGPLTVLATGTAREWPHVFRGCSYVTGVESRNVDEPLDSSDQVSFIERGIPAVQLFTRAHADYHRPGDTPDKVDAAGLVRVATFTKEALAYLVEREEPLAVTIEGARTGHPDAAAERPKEGRRVSFGVVPEFAFAGPGVQASGVVPGSPAEKAGLQAGDVLLRLDGAGIADLRGFSDALRALTPGQTVTATVRRGDEELTLDVTVEKR